LVDRFDAKSLHVLAPSPIILLCGGKINVTTPKPESLREAYTLVYGRPILKEYATVTPEEFKIFAPDGNYQDWLSFESEFAQIVELIILFSESYGSAAELGAFAMDEEISLRLLVVMDDANYGGSSFIKHGPVRRLEERYGKSAVCVLNRVDINISSIEKVADVNLDAFAATISAAIAKRKLDYKERTTFNPGRPGHIIKLIVGLIQHYGALTDIEIEVLLFAMDLTVEAKKIPDYLLCAVNAQWISRDKRGVEEYYCAMPNVAPAIEYKLRKDLPAEDKDRERWRARVIDHWKSKEPDRFSSIQSALKSAL
tara:strand:- start:1489 stop:2424 length:936 start_codon:yes stop_codon:yes gene_type:complete